MLASPFFPLQNKTGAVHIQPTDCWLETSGDPLFLRGYDPTPLQMPDEHIKLTNCQVENRVSTQMCQIHLLMVDEYLQGVCTNRIDFQHYTTELNALQSPLE